jgi:exodeoxyribonuclease VII small subunit
MNDSPDEPMTFEEALGELEHVVRGMEDGSIGLEAALERYERGIRLLQRCYGQLRQAEQKVQQLTGVDAEGQPVTQPFEQAPPAEASRAEPARRRKPGNDGNAIPF